MLYSDVIFLAQWPVNQCHIFPITSIFPLQILHWTLHNTFFCLAANKHTNCYETFVPPDIFWPNYAFPLCCLTPPSLSAGIVSLWGNPFFQQASADQPMRDQSMGRELSVCSVLANGIACVGCGIKSSLTSDLCFRQCEVAEESLCALRRGLERLGKGGRETRNEGEKQRGG